MLRIAFAIVALGIIAQAQTLPNGWTVRPMGEQLSLDTFPLRLGISENGKYLVVLNAGAHAPSLSVIDVASKKEIGRTSLPDAWLGLAITRGDRVYVGGGGSGSVYELALDGATGTLKRTRDFAVQGFIGDVAITANGRFAYAADVLGNSVSVLNLDTAQRIATWKCGRRPYRLLLTPDAKELLVSSWADGSVYALDANNGHELGRTRVGPHATDMLLSNHPAPVEGEGTSTFGARLFVTASNTNSVYTFGLSSDDQLKQIDALSLGLTQMSPLGMTPSAIAMSKDGSTLYVACSDGNSVAVVDIGAVRSRVTGYVPVGAYPTAVQPLPDESIAIANGHSDSLSFVPPLAPESLRAATEVVQQSSPYRDGAQSADMFASLRSSIRHVIYVFVGAGAVNDAGPNLKSLTHTFACFDQVAPIGTNAAEVYQWSVAAIASDFVVKTSQSWYAGRMQGIDLLAGDPAGTPPAGTLWENAQMAGLRTDTGVAKAVTANGKVQQSSHLSAWAATPADVLPKVQTFLKQWSGFGDAEAPQLSVLHLLPEPTASGVAPLAESDGALGMLIDGVSHSKLWSTTAVFVVQVSGGKAGAAVIISPYSRRARVESAPITQLQILRTIEMTLGLRPMTQFDAAASPLSDYFSQAPDVTAYSATR